MYVLLVTVALAVAMVTGESYGYTDNNDEVWAYQWYENEPFVLECNSSKINVSVDDVIVWETPSGMILKDNYVDENYEVSDLRGVHNIVLTIKRVTSAMHGVYICTVHANATAPYHARKILGLNIHERKYRDMFDKYRDNLIVAVIATAVFVVPLGTSCFVYHFQYMTPEDKARRHKRRMGKSELAYVPNDNDLPMKTQNGGDGYENPGFSTQL